MFPTVMWPTPTQMVAYVALFATVGFLFVLASLALGKLLRSAAPTQQKLEAYECGEPAVGPANVQFDLRFYVVALLFIIFEVEVAFFFPPATIFGQAVRQSAGTIVEQTIVDEPIAAAPVGPIGALMPAAARRLALVAMIDLGVFFAVLLGGFAFVWRRGDLDWVRAVRYPTTPAENAALAARWRRSELST